MQCYYRINFRNIGAHYFQGNAKIKNIRQFIASNVVEINLVLILKSQNILRYFLPQYGFGIKFILNLSGYFFNHILQGD